MCVHDEFLQGTVTVVLVVYNNQEREANVQAVCEVLVLFTQTGEWGRQVVRSVHSQSK